uniref:Gamma-secretase subunit PEN-2 n=1 Tax=Plectus sambesii TaxID=2011161 RepID=A0A914W4T1_9BILA
MDLKKVSDDEKLFLCKRYFYWGLALLPFLWLVNVVWFFKQAFIRPPFPQQNLIKNYVIYSGIGLGLWTVLFVTWQVVFQTNRVAWGASGDYLSFVFPKGYA